MTTVNELKRFFQNQIKRDDRLTFQALNCDRLASSLSSEHHNNNDDTSLGQHQSDLEPNVMRPIAFNMLTGAQTQHLPAPKSNRSPKVISAKVKQRESMQPLISSDQMSETLSDHEDTDDDHSHNDHFDYYEDEHEQHLKHDDDRAKQTIVAPIAEQLNRTGDPIDSPAIKDKVRKKFSLSSLIKRNRKVQKPSKQKNEPIVTLTEEKCTNADEETSCVTEAQQNDTTVTVTPNSTSTEQRLRPQPKPRKSLAKKSVSNDGPSQSTTNYEHDNNNLIRPRKLEHVKQNDPRLVAQLMIVNEFKMLAKRRSLMEFATLNRSQAQARVNIDPQQQQIEQQSSDHRIDESPLYVNFEQIDLPQSLDDLSLDNVNANDEVIYESLRFDNRSISFSSSSDSEPSYDLLEDASCNVSQTSSFDLSSCVMDVKSLRQSYSDGNNNNNNDKVQTTKEPKAIRKGLFKFFKRKELAAIKAAKKFALTGFEVPLCAGTVKDDYAPHDKDEINVKHNEVVLVLRIHNNPPGKYLAKNERGHIGYVDLANIRVDPESIKMIVKVYGPRRCNDIDFPTSEL